MGEVKKSDIELVIGALVHYFNYAVQTKKVNLQEFVRYMEPVFKKAGYRNPPQVQGDADFNILIIHDSGAGDLITHSGAIREIRRIYPTARITLVVAPSAIQLAECCPYVDEIISNSRPFSHIFFDSYAWNINFVKLLLTTRFDICYCFARGSSTPLLMYMSGAKTRISQVLTENTPAMDCEVPLKYTINLATHIVPPYEFGKHVVDANFSLLDHFLHIPIANRELELWYTPAEFAQAKNFTRNLPRPLYAFVMGGSAKRKHYPPEKYAEFIKMILAEEPTATFINLGGGKNDGIATQILRQSLGEEIFDKHFINLVNKISYRQSAAILKFCDMYIGNDTGTLNAASVVKCPVLSTNCFPNDLYTGHIDIPRIFAPYRVPAVTVQPKHALPECAVNEPYDNFGCRVIDKPHCITQIKPQTLFEGFKLLKEKISKKIIDTTCIC